jgi:arylsulfatase A-like enzyme
MYRKGQTTGGIEVENKPNVVIIMADQLRKDVINKQYAPNIHALKQESLSFERAYCASPLCVPARGAFFTGLYPNCNGSLMNPGKTSDRKYGFIRAGIANLYQLMESQWDSWHVGKQHLNTEDKFDKSSESMTKWNTSADYKQYLMKHGKRNPGGDKFKGLTSELVDAKHTRMKHYSIPATGCYEEGFEFFLDGYIANSSIEAIRTRDRSKPFLLNAMFLAPHPPLDVPEPWFSSVQTVQLPENVGVWYANQSPLQLYHLPGFVGSRYSREDWESIWPVYLGLVGLLDHAVGMIIEELKAQGMYDDTLIIFTSDHGEMLGSHCLWQKNCMYEESTHIPLYFKFPQSIQPAVHESDQLVSGIDVLPTLCEVLEIAPPGPISGESLMPIVRGETISRDRIFIQYDGNQARGHFQRCVVKQEYKLIVDFFKDEVYLELYDVLKDPQEMKNLAAEPGNKERVLVLLQELRQHMQETDDLIVISDGVYEQFQEALESRT